MKLQGQLTLLINEDTTIIKVTDKNACVCFLRIELNPTQLSLLLSRQANVECDVEVLALDKIGKTMDWGVMEFEIPCELYRKPRKEEFLTIVKNQIPKGFEPDLTFDSTKSFFIKEDKCYARTIIRKWM